MAVLRRQRFLPSQLRAAWLDATSRLDRGELVDDAMQQLFGAGVLEFLPEYGVNHVPLNAHVLAAAALRDQHGRLYAYADPTDYEFDEDALYDDHLAFTDQLFFAVPASAVRAYRRDEQAVDDEALQFPAADDVLRLQLVDSATGYTEVTVLERIYPSADNPRVSSGLVRVDGLLPVARRSPKFASPQAIYESAVRALTV